jgi:hypothetical protein
MRAVFRTTASFLCACVFTSVALGQESEPLTPGLQNLVRAITNASNAEEAARSYIKLFKGANRDKLQRLKKVAQQGVALRAAWEEVLLSGTPRRDAKAYLDLVEPVAVSRFLGFVEGRLEIELPSWWESAVKNAHMGGCGKLTPSLSGGGLYHYVGFGDHKISMPKTMSVQPKEKGAVVRVGKPSIYLSPEIVEEHLRHSHCLSAAVDQDNGYFAFHNDVGVSYPLVCVERKSGNVLWESEVWASAFKGYAGGVSLEHVVVVTKGDCVLVFGSGGYCFYIEAFERATGKNVFRFANWYTSELDQVRK